MNCRNDNVSSRLNHFLDTKKIPNIIFHGCSGSGKRTIVNNFLSRIYNNDNFKLKSNVMLVNCSHGKGIKFIRDELKFFAKTNIQVNDIMFKSIVLLNADSLTIDAQSALRRCIELFSYNTRFFIVVENKNKLLNPILSRFCEIYIPGYDNEIHEKVNLTKNLAREFAPQNVRVNVLCPGFFPAEQNRKILDSQRVAGILSGTPQARFGEPQELVAAAILLLSRQAGSYITGADLYVDGGFTAARF